MSALAPMARAASIPIPRVAEGVVLKPIFVHPSHFEGSAPASPYLGPSTSSFYASYSMSSKSSETPDAETLVRVDCLSLDSSPPSPSSSLASLDSLDSCGSSTDFFAAAFGRSIRSSDAESYFTLDTSPSSSNSSTPTCESPMASFKPASEASEASECSSSLPTAFPASFPFATFAAPASRPATPPVSSVLRRASAAGGSMMARSVSSPVETQRELDQRRRRQADASELMHESATKMARTRSMAAFGSSSMMSRAPSGFGLMPSRPGTPVAQPSCPSPLVTPFEEGWGAALPPREQAEPATLPPFPFNHVGVNYSPGRLNRSHSATYVPQYRAPASSEISSHLSDAAIASLSTSSFSTQQKNSPLLARIPTPPSMTRPRRSTLGLAALTPITPTQGFESAIDALPPMAPHRLTCGASFS
ncbi:BQ2448_540 [Microbotryum intermedium]|uniref:BQ2448_540 protein n=1 Tax=Microbotryum intermedium TaxID=269621 RepID=A0A238F6N8_9BASI|nr:BQ2448_540 [Microbotryum intermedium]